MDTFSVINLCAFSSISEGEYFLVDATPGEGRDVGVKVEADPEDPFGCNAQMGVGRVEKKEEGDGNSIMVMIGDALERLTCYNPDINVFLLQKED